MTLCHPKSLFFYVFELKTQNFLRLYRNLTNDPSWDDPSATRSRPKRCRFCRFAIILMLFYSISVMYKFACMVYVQISHILALRIIRGCDGDRSQILTSAKGCMDLTGSMAKVRALQTWQAPSG